MPIHYVPDQNRALDPETGEYLVTRYIHYQNPTEDFLLYSADDRLILKASIAQDAIPLSPDRKTGMFTIDIFEIVTFLNDGSPVLETSSQSPAAQKLRQFVNAFLLDRPGRTATVEFRFYLKD